MTNKYKVSKHVQFLKYMELNAQVNTFYQKALNLCISFKFCVNGLVKQYKGVAAMNFHILTPSQCWCSQAVVIYRGVYSGQFPGQGETCDHNDLCQGKRLRENRVSITKMHSLKVLFYL